MLNDELIEHLNKVHQELEKASKLTVKERDLFSTLMTDIVNSAAGREQESDQDQTLQQRIDSYITKVEERHPQFAGALRQIMDTLSQIGI